MINNQRERAKFDTLNSVHPSIQNRGLIITVKSKLKTFLPNGPDSTSGKMTLPGTRMSTQEDRVQMGKERF